MTKDYIKSCQSLFWREVSQKEMDYLKRELKGYDKILSVGCGSATIERGLQEADFNIIGLDVSKEALEGSPDSIRTLIGSAEQMNLPDQSFDAVIYVASLQFINNYISALKETARVLRPNGKLIAMLLNPESEFFIKRTSRGDSYMNQVKHRELQPIEDAVNQLFSSKGEFYLGIQGDKIFETQDPKLASLYIIGGNKI